MSTLLKRLKARLVARNGTEANVQRARIVCCVLGGRNSYIAGTAGIQFQRSWYASHDVHQLARVWQLDQRKTA